MDERFSTSKTMGLGKMIEVLQKMNESGRYDSWSALIESNGRGGSRVDFCDSCSGGKIGRYLVNFSDTVAKIDKLESELVGLKLKLGGTR